MNSKILLAAGMVAGLVGSANALEVRMAEIKVKPECLDQFIQEVTKNMKLSVQKEPGVISIYSVADKNDKTKLTFFEIYASPEAYKSHTQTEHFKNYIRNTKDLTLEKTLIPVDAIGLEPFPEKK